MITIRAMLASQELWSSLLAVGVSSVLAFFSVTARLTYAKPRENYAWAVNLGKASVFGCLTYIGPYALTKWNVLNAGPMLGTWWTIGFVSGTGLAWTRIVRTLSGLASALPREERRRLRHFVGSNLLNLGLEETNRRLQKEIKGYHDRVRRLEETKALNLISATARLHDFIHTVRDECSAFHLACEESARRHLLQERNPLKFLDTVLAEHQDFLKKVLADMLNVFGAVLGSGELWAAVRMIRPGEHGNVYKTLVRVPGRYNSREDTSVPIPEGAGLPRYLREQAKAGNAIILIKTRPS